MRVLFLAFDGVLTKLSDDVQPTHTEAEIRDLPDPLGARFIGSVPRGPRGEAIPWFLYFIPTIRSYLVLDDASDEFSNEFAGSGRMRFAPRNIRRPRSRGSCVVACAVEFRRICAPGKNMKPPRGSYQPVLYLDYDGTLHHDNCLWHPRRGAYLHAPAGHVLFQHAFLLAELLAPHPHIVIVLSTSWVRQYGCYDAAKRLPHSLRSRVIGATFHSQMPSGFWDKPRWLQIWEDVLRRSPGSWLAIDNDVADWPSELERHLVVADDALGISPPGIQENLRRRLALLSKLELPAVGPDSLRL